MAGYEVVEAFYDAAVSGADPVHERRGFAAMLARIEGNGVRAVLVETASWFARDILVQETGWRFLRERGIDLIASDSPGAFLDETPTAIMIRQLLGVISEFEKASLVAKLRGARERKKRATGKCEGRKSTSELRPDVVALARKLQRRRSKPSLRAISSWLRRAISPAPASRSRHRSWRGCCAAVDLSQPLSPDVQPDPVAKDHN
jgi:DNA invertase Pin-like site-specific DNA recombinase